MLQPCDTGPAALAPESIALRSPQACRFRRSTLPKNTTQTLQWPLQGSMILEV